MLMQVNRSSQAVLRNGAAQPGLPRA